MPIAFTFTEWIILLLVFVLGWLLGLLSRSGGRRWRRQYEAERDAHATYRRDTEDRLAAMEAREAEFGHRAAPAAPTRETARFRKDGRPL